MSLNKKSRLPKKYWANLPTKKRMVINNTEYKNKLNTTGIIFFPAPSKNIAEKFFSLIFSFSVDSFKTLIQPAIKTAANKNKQIDNVTVVIIDFAENIYGKRKLIAIKNKTKNKTIAEFSFTVSNDFLIKPENI